MRGTCSLSEEVQTQEGAFPWSQLGGWLVGWLVGSLVGWLVGQLIG
jgi:hypothetical protein